MKVDCNVNKIVGDIVIFDIVLDL